MRITMGMISKQYSKSLNNSLSQLNSASNKATTYRAFDKTSEDPFGAAKAYRLRRESVENDTYQANVTDLDSQFTTAESAMMSIHTIVSGADTGDILQGITGTMAPDDRKIIANKLRKLQDAIISPANTKFGDKYLFGGSDMTDPPFSVELGSDGKKQLFYRGINVDDGTYQNGPATDFNGAFLQFGKGSANYTISVTAGSPYGVSVTGSTINITVDASNKKTNEDLLNTLKSIDPSTFSKVTMTGDMSRPIPTSMTSVVTKTQADATDMANLAGEKSLVDLGMGLRLGADGKIDPQSAFDAAIPGISFLGYGQTSDGISNNLYSLLGQVADQLESNDFSIDKIKPYLTQFSKQNQMLMSEVTKAGTKSNFLATSKSNLEAMGDAITDKDQAVEFVDPADAIMDYYMQQYSYNAALQMGTKIMAKTFLDFMT